MKKVVIDKKDNLIVDLTQTTNQRVIEFLKPLGQGLEMLYNRVANYEREYFIRDLIGSSSWISLSQTQEEAMHLDGIAMAFQWYSVSVCSFVNLVGRMVDSSTQRDYVERVCGSVLLYRNKVAAHTAFAEPTKSSKKRAGDNWLDEMNSLFQLPRFNQAGRLLLGAVPSVTTDWKTGKVLERSNHVYELSLTEFHVTEFLPRYGHRLFQIS